MQNEDVKDKLKKVTDGLTLSRRTSPDSLSAAYTLDGEAYAVIGKIPTFFKKKTVESFHSHFQEKCYDWNMVFFVPK